MKSLAGVGEDTAVAGPFAGGEVSSLEVEVNHMASGLSPGSGSVGYDTQVGRRARTTWA